MREEGKSAYCQMEDGTEKKIAKDKLLPLKKSRSNTK
jgi:hypothetical protein